MSHSLLVACAFLSIAANCTPFRRDGNSTTGACLTSYCTGVAQHTNEKPSLGLEPYLFVDIVCCGSFSFNSHDVCPYDNSAAANIFHHFDDCCY